MSEIVVLQQEDKKGENYLRTVFNVVEQRLKKQEQINKYFFSDVVQNKQLSSSFIADVEKAKGLIIILSSMEEADLQAWVSHQKTVTGKIILPIIVNQEINFGIKTKYDLKLFVSCVGRFYFLDGISLVLHKC